MVDEPGMDHPDALVGLRFDVGGGLSRMSGRVLGKAGGLYLVQKSDCDYCELLQLDDLRSAKFYRDPPAVTAQAGPSPIALSPPNSAPSDLTAPVDPGVAAAVPGRRRLADQIRRQLGRTE